MRASPGELASFLRAQRARVEPASVGLPSGGDRRVAGLRREEVAVLAVVSADYYTRLEQGRERNPSAQVVNGIAHALRLDADARAHLFRLAGLVLPGPDTVPRYITPSVHRLLDRLSGTPVAVSDATWTLLTCNQAYAALMGDPSGWRGNQRNGVWRNLVEPRASRVRQVPEARREFEAALVSDLRTAMARYPADRRLKRLVADLHANSPRFAELWDSGAVGRHEATERKTIDHPQAGTLTLDCDVLTVQGSDLHIMIYTAEPGTQDAERLALLTVLGTQTLVG